MVLQRCLINRKPHQWRGPTMIADQRQHNRRMIVGVEVSPVHGNNNIWTLPNHIRNPSFGEFVDIYPGVWGTLSLKNMTACSTASRSIPVSLTGLDAGRSPKEGREPPPGTPNAC